MLETINATPTIGLSNPLRCNNFDCIIAGISEYMHGCKEYYVDKKGIFNLIKYCFYAVFNCHRDGFKQAQQLDAWIAGMTSDGLRKAEQCTFKDHEFSRNLHNYLLKHNEKSCFHAVLTYNAMLSWLSVTATAPKLTDDHKSTIAKLLKGELGREWELHQRLFDEIKKLYSPALPEKSAKEILALENKTQQYEQSIRSLIAASPFEELAAYSFSRQKKEADKKMRELNGLMDQAQGVPDILARLRAQHAILSKHCNFLDVLADNNFANAENFKFQQQRQLKTAIKVLEQAVADNETAKSKLTSITSAKYCSLSRSSNVYQRKIRSLTEELQNLKTRSGEFPTRNFTAQLRINENGLKSNLIKLGLSSSYLSKHWEKCKLEIINNEGWKTVEKKLQLRVAKQHIPCTSTIKPAACIRFYTTKKELEKAKETGCPEGRDPFIQTYNGGAYASITQTKTDHPLNLHQTSARCLLPDGKDKELFAGIRSGTIAARGLNRTKQKEAGDSWAQEIVTSALIHKLERSPEAYAQMRQQKPVTIKLGTLSLMTPDLLRRILPIDTDERRLQQVQYEALNRLAEQSRTSPLTVYDAAGNEHSVYINLDIATMNVGVNELSLHPQGAAIIYSRGKADEYTQEGLKKIMGSIELEKPLSGWVGSWLKDDKASDSDRKIVQSLCQQIKYIFKNKLHHTEGQDAYKLVTRIQVLLHYIGAVPHFNCKSGKDRTGEADAQIKELAFQLTQSDTVPDPEQEWSKERRECLQAFLYGAGEQEVLMYNTGEPEYKTGMNQKLKGRLFPSDALRETAS